MYSLVCFHLVDTVWEAWFIACCQAGANGEESKGAAAEQTEASQCRVWGGWETKALGQICHLHVQTMERKACLTRDLLPFILNASMFLIF